MLACQILSFWNEAFGYTPPNSAIKYKITASGQSLQFGHGLELESLQLLPDSADANTQDTISEFLYIFYIMSYIVRPR